jgi:hypothetical protein
VNRSPAKGKFVLHAVNHCIEIYGIILEPIG